MNNFIDIVRETNRKPLLIDLNNMLYRSRYVFTPDKFKSHQGLPNGHLFGLCQILRTADKLGYEIFLCEDSLCNWRKELNENYKGNREPSENRTEFWKDYPKIRDLISDIDNIHSLQADRYEADDLMYSGAKICSRLGIECSIFSADKDLLQTLDEYVTIVHKITLSGNEEIKYGSKEYEEKFPVEPCKLPIYRAFKGDASDNLEPPVKRFPKNLILDLVDYLYEHHDLKGYEIKKKSHEKWLTELTKAWPHFLSNYKIMKLNDIDFKVLDKSSKGAYLKVAKDYDLYQWIKYNEELHNIK